MPHKLDFFSTNWKGSLIKGLSKMISGGRYLLDNISFQAEEGNTGTKGDGGGGGGGGHQPHHGAPLQRGEQPCRGGRRWGAGGRKIPEAKTENAS